MQSSEVISTPLRVSITFVDRDSFVRLQSPHFKMDEFVTLVHSARSSESLSVMSHAYLAELNTRLSELVLGSSFCFSGPAQTPREAKYTAFAVWQDMTVSCEDFSEKTPELCYDALPVDGQNLLIVVQKGFLYHLADNKDNYKKFVLACIRCMDRFNCDLSQLNQLYLQLQLTEAPFELLRCRIQ